MTAYDYVIVGAGSAGCVIANRLSEDPTVSVLILEAGEQPTGLFRNMPAAIKQTMMRADLDWGFKSEPEPGLNGRQLSLIRGKTVGGCSQINGMIYARGHPKDYDDWAAMGCDGWSYEDVLPYFKRSETSWTGENAFHGGDGPLGVSRPRDASLMTDKFEAAARNAGYAANDDYHAEPNEGFVPIELTASHGRRANTGSAFLAPVLARRNLTLVTGAQGARVVLENGRAVGVEYVKDGQPVTARADGEVILSAGAYGSPQILMASGIGPADELREAGIALRHDLPGVGKNLIEHPMLYMQFAARQQTFLNELRFDKAVLSVLRWATTGEGPFATNACAGNMYVKTDPTLDRPDMQFGLPVVAMGAGLWAPWKAASMKHGMSLGVIALAQDSRGEVRLRSADPLAAPRITLNLLTEASDMTRMIRGVRIARDYYRQAPLSDIITGELAPGAQYQTDEELAAVLRANCATAHHPVGTCKMGVDADSVVDPQLRVRGVLGLRVADASIMPTIPGGNTNVPAIMIGEKASDLIRGRTQAVQAA
jgi:choline dehydrogenase